MPRSKRDTLGIPRPEKVKVNIIESERGWGSKIDEVREFDTLELARAFCAELNSQNTEDTAPDWYMRAEVVR